VNLAVPDFQSFFLPLLRFNSDGKTYSANCSNNTRHASRKICAPGGLLFKTPLRGNQSFVMGFFLDCRTMMNPWLPTLSVKHSVTQRIMGLLCEVTE
jgi:hypothetical protein